jgi:hypothetical protein
MVAAAFFSSKSSKNRWLGRIRTGVLRRVKREDLGIFEAFSLGDITVKKANGIVYSLIDFCG